MIFLDTSAFIKRYIQEQGSDDVNNLCAHSDIALSALCLPEMMSALNRFKRESILREKDYRSIKQDILEDIQDLHMMELSEEIVMMSVHCLEKSVLKASDSIHIATAVFVKASLFVSADLQQIKAAQLLGLVVKRI